jgi:hypothetical protein
MGGKDRFSRRPSKIYGASGRRRRPRPKALINFLCGINIDRDVAKTARAMLTTVASQYCYKNYSGVGRKNTKKPAFVGTKMYRCMVEAMRNSFGRFDQKKFETTICTYMRAAPFRGSKLTLASQPMKISEFTHHNESQHEDETAAVYLSDDDTDSTTDGENDDSQSEPVDNSIE